MEMLGVVKLPPIHHIEKIFFFQEDSIQCNRVNKISHFHRLTFSADSIP